MTIKLRAHEHLANSLIIITFINKNNIFSADTTDNKKHKDDIETGRIYTPDFPIHNNKRTNRVV